MPLLCSPAPPPPSPARFDTGALRRRPQPRRRGLNPWRARDDRAVSASPSPRLPRRCQQAACSPRSPRPGATPRPLRRRHRSRTSAAHLHLGISRGHGHGRPRKRQAPPRHRACAPSPRAPAPSSSSRAAATASRWSPGHARRVLTAWSPRRAGARAPPLGDPDPDTGLHHSTTSSTTSPQAQDLRDLPRYHPSAEHLPVYNLIERRTTPTPSSTTATRSPPTARSKPALTLVDVDETPPY